MDQQNHPAPAYPTSPIQYVAQQPEGAVLYEKHGFPAQQQQAIVTAPVNYAPPRNVYQCAKPLDSLQVYPAVIDCPRCGVREMTIATPESGNTHCLWEFFCCPITVVGPKDFLHKCGACGVPVAFWHWRGYVEVLPQRGAEIPCGVDVERG